MRAKEEKEQESWDESTRKERDKSSTNKKRPDQERKEKESQKKAQNTTFREKKQQHQSRERAASPDFQVKIFAIHVQLCPARGNMIHPQSRLARRWSNQALNRTRGVEKGMK